MTSPATKKSVSLSLIVGTLLVPFSAVATVWLSDAGAEVGATVSPPETSLPAEVAPVPTPLAETTPTSVDFEMACGAEGLGLVALESSGAITDLQQGALDALRPLCAQQGLALPPPPVPDPIVQTVVAPAAFPTPTTVTTVDDDRDDDDHWDDDHDEREDDRYDDHHRDDDRDEDDD